MISDEQLYQLTCIPHLDLGITFDVDKLLEEYKALPSAFFQPYQSSLPQIRELIGASWHGCSLMSPDGSLHNDLREDKQYHNRTLRRTTAAERCPYMMEVINTLGDENESRARIMKVNPGGRLTWHSHQFDDADYKPEYIVVHVPIIAPEEFRYSVISIAQFRFNDIENYGLDVVSENYPAGRATMFNCFHMHNVFNDSNEPRVSIMMYLNVKNPKTYEIVSKAVEKYNGPWMF